MDDITAISTWERADAPDPAASGPGHPYRCTACDWTGRGETGLRHYRATGHAIRGRDWPASWPDVQFMTPPVHAIFAFEQDDFHGGSMRLYTIVGGTHDKSTVTAETLAALGIEVLR